MKKCLACDRKFTNGHFCPECGYDDYVTIDGQKSGPLIILKEVPETSRKGDDNDI